MTRVFVLLVAFFLVPSTKAQTVDTIKVKVHDHVMTLYSSGNSKPTVIMESGGGSTHRAWRTVQAMVASTTRVVSYDRPGYLNSDSCVLPGDALRVAKELREALSKANIQPPYILTGWSLGGAFVRVFAGLYSKDVVGMILVDPTPEDFYTRAEKEIPEFAAGKASYFQEVMNKGPQGERTEMMMFDSSMNQARRSDASHTTTTTLLIAADKTDGVDSRDSSHPVGKIWIGELENWGKKRPNVNYQLITNSGHNIARSQPDIVVNAIIQLVNQYNSRPK